MGTKQTTTQTSNFDQAGMSAYDKMQPGLANYTSSWLGMPYNQTPGYNMLLGQNMGAAQSAAGTGQYNLMNNMKALSGGAMAMNPFQQALMQQQGASAAALKLQALQNTNTTALNQQNNAANVASGYRPLQTGSNSVQQTSGLGTWLPQLLGAAGGAALGLATGGASSAFALNQGMLAQPGGLGQPGFNSGTFPSSFMSNVPASAPNMGTGYGIPSGGSALNYAGI